MNEDKVCCFGEVLLRMSPALNRTWLNEARMPVYVGGAEANVATALASWGLAAAYCTAMPDHALGREVAAYFAGRGVDVSAVRWTGERIGIYFLPQGSDLQHAGVIYDRGHSGFASLDTGDIDWDKAFEGCAWFHFSAITPALNARLARVCKEALEAASRRGMRVSVDLNYRPKLWQYGVAPVSVMPELVACADLVMGNLWAAESLLGIPVDRDIHLGADRERYLDHARRTSAQILKEYPRCTRVANTFRFGDAGGLRYFATLSEGRDLHISAEFVTDRVVDKVGSGDCFMAGLLYGLIRQHDPATIINFAAAAAFGKLHEAGDSTSQSVAQVNSIVRQYAS